MMSAARSITGLLGHARFWFAQIGSGKCESSLQRGTTCQCTCGTTLPKLARLIFVGAMRSLRADSVTHTAFINAERCSMGRSVISAAWWFSMTRQNPGHAGSLTRIILYKSAAYKMSSSTARQSGQVDIMIWGSLFKSLVAKVV